MRRGDVVQAQLDPVEGSEQGGIRPVVVVSRDVITANSPIVIVVPVSKLENFARVYPSQVKLSAGTGGLTRDSVAMAEQVRTISQKLVTRLLGHLPDPAIADIDAKLKIALDLK